MTRKELYRKIKELGLASIIQERYKDHYTRITNANLEACIKDYLGKEKRQKTITRVATTAPSVPLKDVELKTIFIKLISTLQSKRLLTAKEAEEITKLL